MSVIHYMKDEVLDAIAACWNRGSIGSLDAQRHLGHLAELGNQIMAANAGAYSHTYNEAVEPQEMTGPEIKRRLVGFTVDRKLRGMRCLRGIRYNLIANDGKDFATAEILDGLLTLWVAAYELAGPRNPIAYTPEPEPKKGWWMDMGDGRQQWVEQ